MEVTGLLRNWFQEWVTATDKILPLVTLDIPHPHANSAGFCALGGRNKSSVGNLRQPEQFERSSSPSGKPVDQGEEEEEEETSSFAAVLNTRQVSQHPLS